MAIVKEFNHPLHVLNYCRAMMRKELRRHRPITKKAVPLPLLDSATSYYFVFETAHRPDLDKVLWSICSFDADGVILFSSSGCMPVSYYRYIRQGLARTTTMIEGTIKGAFRKYNVPLSPHAPFVADAHGLYRVNISWSVYHSLIK